MTSPWKEKCCDFVDPHILNVIADDFKFDKLTPVQEATIPIFCKSKDVCVEAVTGSGKTLAFLVPMLQTIKNKNPKPKKLAVLCLIISPTQELASQIIFDLKRFLGHKEFLYTCQLLIGGFDAKDNNDLSKYEEHGAHIIVGTPGRLKHACEGSEKLRAGLKELEVLIIDEADRLLDTGFHKDITTIFSYLPKQRRTGLFSATLTDGVEQLIKAGLRDPVKIIVKEKTLEDNGDMRTVRTPHTLSNKYVECTETNKFNKLITFISQHKDKKLIVFLSTCASVNYFSHAIKELLNMHDDVHILHGKLKSKQRSKITNFRNLDKGVLVCTNLVARGIDIPDIDWVLQYDPPSSASDFVHRCGRTARSGKRGNALLFLLEHETSYVHFLERNQKAPMEEFFVEEEDSWLGKLKNLSLKDRACMQLGKLAFVSSIQAYSKHECEIIFRPKDIKFGRLATGFGLLQMPIMPEINRLKPAGKQEIADNFTAVDDDKIKNIKFKDRQREKQRRENLKRPAPEKDSRPKLFSKKAKAWSESRFKKEEQKTRKEEKRQKRKRQKEKMKFNEEEEEELRRDAALVKKLKNGKITKEEYDEAMSLEENKLLDQKPEEQQTTTETITNIQ